MPDQKGSVMTVPLSPWLTRAEASKALGLSPWYVHHLATRRGLIRREECGGGVYRRRYRYSRADVMRLARKLERFGTLTAERGGR